MKDIYLNKVEDYVLGQLAGAEHHDFENELRINAILRLAVKEFEVLVQDISDDFESDGDHDFLSEGMVVEAICMLPDLASTKSVTRKINASNNIKKLDGTVLLERHSKPAATDKSKSNFVLAKRIAAVAAIALLLIYSHYHREGDPSGSTSLMNAIVSHELKNYDEIILGSDNEQVEIKSICKNFELKEFELAKNNIDEYQKKYGAGDLDLLIEAIVIWEIAGNDEKLIREAELNLLDIRKRAQYFGRVEYPLVTYNLAYCYSIQKRFDESKKLLLDLENENCEKWLFQGQCENVKKLTADLLQKLN